MSVGILLITHDDIGSALLESLEKMLGTLPLPVKILPIRHENEFFEFCYHAKNICNTLNKEHGVLVLTDLFAATPCNIASKLIPDCRVRVVAGLNFPMLVRIMNYSTADLDTMVSIAISGGCQGILDVNSVIEE
ncbi:MAG: PTS mannose transporter subunit IIA [Candidatus Marithrix sp.]|nr:PTS fructose transporter subunit IIA [Thioploca sp.]